MKITLSLNNQVHFTAVNEAGTKVDLDGPASIGGQNKGMRPIELFLSAMIACMSLDVVHIIRKSRCEIIDYKVEASGNRRTEPDPKVFTDIHLLFSFKGAIPPEVAARAVKLSVEKYCSIKEMLKPEVKVTYEIVPFVD